MQETPLDTAPLAKQLKYCHSWLQSIQLAERTPCFAQSFADSFLSAP
jgi:hypothetical protein